MRIVVLASPDEAAHIAPRVANDCSLYQLKVLWSDQFNVPPDELLVRNEDGSILEDNATVQTLSSDRTPPVIYLSIEECVSIALRAYDSEVPKENGLVNLSPNGVDENDDVIKVDGKRSFKETRTLNTWMSLTPSELLSDIRALLEIRLPLPLRLFAGRQPLNLEQSFADQGVRDGTLVEVEEVLRDISVQTSPPLVLDKECSIRPDVEEIGVQCHRVPEMVPQPMVVDCLFPEEGWRSVDEILQPDEALAELIPKAASQLNISVDSLHYIFQVGILFPLPETVGEAIQVMRGSSRQYIDERGREVKEDDRVAQTLTPLHPDDLPTVHPIGKPVVTVWRDALFMEVDPEGLLQALDNGMMALDDKRFCAFYRALRVIGSRKRAAPESPEVNGLTDSDRHPAVGEEIERLFLRVTALVYVDAATGEQFNDEEKALVSCDGEMERDSITTNFIVVLVAGNRSLPKYNLPKNRYLALFTRQEEDLVLTEEGKLRRLQGCSHRRTWILPKEVSKLMRDITQYFTSQSSEKQK